jgi:hypothetical protein
MDSESTMPSPFPLEAAVNSTADLKNAELCAEEATPSTQKHIEISKQTDKEFAILAKKKGFVKKVDLISLPLKEAISDYFAVVISALVLFVTTAVTDPQSDWNITPFSVMTLVKSLLVALPILMNAWRRNGKKEPLPTLTEPL